MASRRDRRRDRREERKDDRQAEEAKDDRGKRRKHEGGGPGGTVTERIKAQSHQTGDQAMGAAPGSYPRDPANADAVYTTGPGEVVSYNYVRVDGTGDYAPQQSSYTAPVAGHGQVLTPAAAGDMPAGMENNPT